MRCVFADCHRHVSGRFPLCSMHYAFRLAHLRGNKAFLAYRDEHLPTLRSYLVIARTYLPRLSAEELPYDAR